MVDYGSNYEVRCRCPGCLHAQNINVSRPADDPVLCRKCGKISEFQKWNGFWQVAEVENLRRRIEVLIDTAKRWHKFLLTYGIAAAAVCLFFFWLLSSFILPHGGAGLVAIIVLVLAVFAIGFYLSVKVRKHVFDTIGFTLFVLFFAEAFMLAGVILVSIYGPSGSEKAGTITLLALIGLIGAVFFLSRVRTDELRRVIEDAQLDVNLAWNYIDGGQYWIEKVRGWTGHETGSGQIDTDAEGPGSGGSFGN